MSTLAHDAIQSHEQPKRFAEHLRELWLRFLWSFAVFTIVFGIAYYFKTPLLHIFLLPLHEPIFYTAPAGGLLLVFKMCTLTAFIITFPIFIYNLLRFLQPAMPARLTRYIHSVLVLSYALAITGITLAYTIILPTAIKFLSRFDTGQVHSLITTDEYFSFIMIYLIGMMIIFQIPIIIILINAVIPLNPKKLFKLYRWVIVLSLVAAAFFAPPEPVNQTVVAAPIILLYGGSIMLVAFINRNRLTASTDAAESSQTSKSSTSRLAKIMRYWLVIVLFLIAVQPLKYFAWNHILVMADNSLAARNYAEARLEYRELHLVNFYSPLPKQRQTLVDQAEKDVLLLRPFYESRHDAKMLATLDQATADYATPEQATNVCQALLKSNEVQLALLCIQRTTAKWPTYRDGWITEAAIAQAANMTELESEAKKHAILLDPSVK